MRKNILDHWLDNLDSLFTTYAAVAKMSGTLLEQTHRSRSDALHLFFELSNRQLGQFWSWYYPDALNTINPSARNSTGIALAIGLDDEALATLHPILAHKGQRLVIIQPSTGHRSASVDFNADHLQCDIRSDKACDNLITRLEAEIGPVELLIKQSTARSVRGVRTRGILDKELDCIYNLTRHLIPGMISRGHGRIIILKPEPEPDQRTRARYAGITSFIRSLARELSQFGITVECLAAAAMGDIETPNSANRGKVSDPPDGYLSDTLDMPGQTLTP